jgi:cytochrome c-type biogenesis protein CcmH
MRLIAVALLWLPLAAFAQGAQPTAQDPVANKRAVGLAEQLRCLVCQNQTIAESNAPLALDLRQQINEQIAQGRSDAEITDYMVQRYGDFVLYRPPVKPVTLLLWFGPPALLLAGLAALIFNLRRRRSRAEEVSLTDAERREAQSLLDDGGPR